MVWFHDAVGLFVGGANDGTDLMDGWMDLDESMFMTDQFSDRTTVRSPVAQSGEP
jgi:hypothetical protein